MRFATTGNASLTAPRMFPLDSILGLGQFLVAATGNHAHHWDLVRDFVNFQTDFGIHSHPFGLLPEG